MNISGVLDAVTRDQIAEEPVGERDLIVRHDEQLDICDAVQILEASGLGLKVVSELEELACSSRKRLP